MILLVSGPIVLMAQENKTERETRIKKSDTPLEILNVLEPYLKESTRIKYYKEIDGDHRSFEVKFKWKSKRYSIEFLEDVRLEDIEVTIPFETIDQGSKEQILLKLQTYDRYKVRKTQKQYSSDQSSAAETISKAMRGNNEITIRYEIVLDTKSKGVWSTTEMTFDQSGQFLFEKQVIKRSEDHILY